MQTKAIWELEKCSFLVPSVTFIGYIVSSDAFQMFLKKLRQLKVSYSFYNFGGTFFSWFGFFL